MVDTLLNELLQQVELGERADSSFKKEAWTACIVAIKDIQSRPVSLEQCKSKVDLLKEQWKNFNWLRGHSGFGWDEEKGLVTAPSKVWDEICKVFTPISLLG